ncbi:MAG: hypothetical protein DYG98_17010 [Haliscomenobacteraceae bacterium CHB4]|nr:hypothetical protein [Saprospiraceae bacterium]MCE7924751.1 hypothetical protein [Haliscomenobacteraceae bacterium CHB4]
MKKYSALLLFLALAVRIPAQLPAGAVAPDFIAQDISGQTWHLYDLLDQGKIVVLEISATWCPPCWAYHNSHAMQELYEAHGPEGDNTLQVLFVEGDPATNTDCLSGPPGCNNFTPGNWLNGTTYPYFDNAAIADSFQVSYFPTLYVVCPNKKTYQIGQLNAAGLWEKASACPVASGVNNAGIFDFSAGTEQREICDGLNVKPSFSLVNLGSNPLTSATFTLQWNSELQQTKEWYGNLPLYGEVPITFDSLILDSPGTLKTTLTSVNNNPGDEDFSDNVHNDHFTAAAEFSTTQILLKIKTDDYGAETYWELRDGQDNVLYHGGNSNVGPDGGGVFGNILPGPGAYANNVLINKTLALPGDGCYSLLLVDAYGDGMCCDYGNGYYKLFNSSNPVVPVLNGGEFGALEHRGFRIKSTTGIFDPDQHTALNLLLSPVPASGFLNLGFTLAEPSFISASVFNALGQTARQYPARQLESGEHTWKVPLDNCPSGAYFLRFQVGEEIVVKWFWVK